ncbi:MAG: ABC transporter substrate-binding protein [Actinobacteria bacterium]|nr:ABC transporter substrate-binding protein [Actinomycetota bacterium]
MQKKSIKIKNTKNSDINIKVSFKKKCTTNGKVGAFANCIIISISILLLFLLLAGLSGLAGCSRLGNTTVSENKNLLVVGSDTTYPPFEFIENGDITGFDIDLIKEIASRMKKEIEITSSSWDPKFKDLIDGKLDIIISAVPIESERTDVVDYSRPYYTLEYLMVSLSGSEIRIKEDLAGKTIGALKLGKSNISGDYLKNYKVLEYEDIISMLDALGNKEIEAVLINLPLAVSLLKDNKDMYLVLDKINSDREFAIVFKKGSPLVSEVNKILDTMITDGKYKSIYDKWFNYNF